MKYFTIEELAHSDYAKRHVINNNASTEVVASLTELTNKVLDPARAKLGRAIEVNSGYRSRILNTRLKGARTSQHMKGEAADLDAGSRELNKKLFEIIRDTLPYDQLINEHNYAWIHVSYKEYGNRKQVLKIG